MITVYPSISASKGNDLWNKSGIFSQDRFGFYSSELKKNLDGFHDYHNLFK
jgi:hypothetical protein